MVDVARGRHAADRVLVGGRVLDLATGELRPATVAIVGERIAFVGPHRPELVGPDTAVYDATDRIIAPAYLEPHGHPFPAHHPMDFLASLRVRGVTAVVLDTLLYAVTVPPEQLSSFLAQLARSASHVLFGASLPGATAVAREVPNDPAAFGRQLDLLWTIQLRELDGWPALIDGGESLDLVVHAKNRGFLVDGHTAGASLGTVAAVAAAGCSACHEAITADQVLDRLRAGLYVFLRHSSFRPDLPELLKAYPRLVAEGGTLGRLCFTLDGPTLRGLRGGATDVLIAEAIRCGVHPVHAYQMASLNPAIYFGLDQDLGLVAPGRLADVVVLEKLDRPTPVAVFSCGRLVAEKGRSLVEDPEPDWTSVGLGPFRLPAGRSLHPELFSQPTEGVHLAFEETVITRQRPVPLGGATDLLHAVFLSPDKSTVTKAYVSGIGRLDGLASSVLVTGRELLVLGRSPAAMLHAAERLLEIGGGMVLVEGRKVVAELPLPHGGYIPRRGLEQLLWQESRLDREVRQRGYAGRDLLFTSFFASSSSLPEVRFGSEGVWEVKSGRLLSRSLPWQ